MQRSERWAARIAGLPTYNTGKPCTNGHLSDRYTASGGCIECIKGYASMNNAKNASKVMDNIARLNSETEVVNIFVHDDDVVAIKAVLDDLIQSHCPELNVDYVNPNKVSKKYIDINVIKMAVRVPIGYSQKMLDITKNMLKLTNGELRKPELPQPLNTSKNKIPEDFNNI